MRETNHPFSITRRLAIMNLAIHGIEADIGKEHADTFRNVQHPDLRADFIIANPPFYDSETALRGSEFQKPEGTPQVVSAARHYMAGRCKVGVQKSELRISRVFNSTLEIQHSSFSPSSNQSGEGDRISTTYPLCA